MNSTTKFFSGVLAVLIILTLWSSHSQQPQTQTAPIYAANAKYTNGVAPGYWAKAGSGLTLNLSAGTSFCSGSVDTYAGGTLTMTASTTNNIYLNTSSSCAPATKTTAFTKNDIPIAQVITGSSTITSIADVRTPFNNLGFTGGVVPYAVAGGTANAMTAAFTPTITALTAGLQVLVLPIAANTTSNPTLNVDGTGAKTIWSFATGALPFGTNGLTAGDYNNLAPASFIYDGTEWQLQNPQGRFLQGPGTCASPAYSFWSASDYGMFVGSGALRLCRSGNDILDVQINGVTINGQILGTYVNPGLTTVGSLGSASGHLAGTIISVSDGSGVAGATCAGGGTTYQIALSNGTTWTCR
jgi:hypothetical protein